MKIGIISLPLDTNYGGILQTYALQTILERMGHDVTFIQRRNWPIKIRSINMLFTYIKRIIKNLLGRHDIIFYEKIYNHDAPIIRQNIEPFILKNIKMKIVDDYCQIQEKEFDAIVVGSDQIWRPLYAIHIENYFLDFAKNWNIKKIAYAASFGTLNWEFSKTQSYTCRNLIQSFSAISVREDSGVELCKRHFGIEAKHVLDPTMLLDNCDYIKLFKKKNTPKSHGNLLCYILDESEEKFDIVKTISTKRNLKPFKVNARPEYRYDIPVEERIQPSVEQWLRGFYDADFVITDSFHACVFSILFGKPFIVYGNKDRGLSRFTSLLNMFGLQDRIVNNISDVEPLIFKEIDWNSVFSNLSILRNKSIDFIRLALN